MSSTSHGGVLALDDKLPLETVREILGVAAWNITGIVNTDELLDVRDVWQFGLREQRPFRTNAEKLGVTLPEPGLELWADAVRPRCFRCGMAEAALAASGLLRRCGREAWPKLVIHHICRRPHCHKPHRDWPENLFWACPACHEGELATMEAAAQLALKWRADHAGWASLSEFLNRWLRVGDPELKAPNRLTVAEIQEHLTQ